MILLSFETLTRKQFINSIGGLNSAGFNPERLACEIWAVPRSVVDPEGFAYMTVYCVYTTYMGQAVAESIAFISDRISVVKTSMRTELDVNKVGMIRWSIRDPEYRFKVVYVKDGRGQFIDLSLLGPVRE